MNSDPKTLHLERNTVFVLAALILTGIVSIAFFNLDRHPAFPAPSDEFVDAIEDTNAALVLADDPVSLAVLEQRQSEISAAIRPVTSWPPKAKVVTFGAVPDRFRDHFEPVIEESVWTLWKPQNRERTPVFATATVEVEDRAGRTRRCPREPDGAHQCGDAGWTRIGTRQLTVDGQREECIWAHPIDGKTLRIHYPDLTVPVGDEGLEFRTALRDAAVGIGTDVDFEIHVGDDTTSHRHIDRIGWQSTPLPAVDKPRPLTVEVTASEVGRRHVCFGFEPQ